TLPLLARLCCSVVLALAGFGLRALGSLVFALASLGFGLGLAVALGGLRAGARGLGVLLGLAALGRGRTLLAAGLRVSFGLLTGLRVRTLGLARVGLLALVALVLALSGSTLRLGLAVAL